MSSILTVLADAPTRDLTTLATVKDELGITDGESDARLSRWIREVSGLVESYCNRVFAQQTVQETFRFARGPEAWVRDNHRLVLQLKRRPVASIASVTEDTTALVAGADFEADLTLGHVWRLISDMTTSRRIAFQSANLVSVVYTGGYALMGGLPYPIEQACLGLLKHRWAARRRDPLLRSQNIPGVIEQQYWVGAVGDNGALPPEIEDLLTAYREIAI